MRSQEEHVLVRDLFDAGLNNCEISRRTGIPISTVRQWRTGPLRSAAPARESCATCGHPVHDFAALPHEDYAYLLGLYLGDGFIAAHRRGVFRLVITLDQKYPEIIDACAAAMGAVIGKEPNRARKQGAVDVNTYSKMWPCLFPQHGTGPKHKRLIVLADWQREIVDKHTEAFLRGLIHSDGCRSMNRIAGRRREYTYPRYTFSNVSEDIKRIFCDACDAVGIEWRRMNAKNISVARRASVARLDEFVGPKR